MKRFIILILVMLLLPLKGIAEEIPPRGTLMTKETNPIYWSYFEDYAALLKKAFEAKKIRHRRGWGAAYDFIITRNGEIKNIEGSVFQNDYYDEVVKDIILSVKPIAFYDGMNEDELLFTVYLGYQRYEEVDIQVGFSLIKNKKIVGIDIDLNK